MLKDIRKKIKILALIGVYDPICEQAHWKPDSAVSHWSKLAEVLRRLRVPSVLDIASFSQFVRPNCFATNAKQSTTAWTSVCVCVWETRAKLSAKRRSQTQAFLDSGFAFETTEVKKAADGTYPYLDAFCQTLRHGREHRAKEQAEKRWRLHASLMYFDSDIETVWLVRAQLNYSAHSRVELFNDLYEHWRTTATYKELQSKSLLMSNALANVKHTTIKFSCRSIHFCNCSSVNVTSSVERPIRKPYWLSERFFLQNSVANWETILVTTFPAMESREIPQSSHSRTFFLFVYSA